MGMETLGMEARVKEQGYDRGFTRHQDRGTCFRGCQRHSPEAVGVLLAGDNGERAGLKGGSPGGVKELAGGDDSSRLS